jgi:hypothetical protein
MIEVVSSATGCGGPPTPPSRRAQVDPPLLVCRIVVKWLGRR